MNATEIKCKAKDPSSCRYHGTGASQIMKERYEKANKQLIRATQRMNEDSVGYYDARFAQEEAEADYYATPEGYKELEAELAEAQAKGDEEEIAQLEMFKTLSAFRLDEAEQANERDRLAGGSLLLGPHKEGYTPPQPMIGGGNELWPTATGAKYNPDFTTRNIKTEVIKDLKEAQKARYLPPHLRFDVRANQRNLSVTIIGATKEQIVEDESDYYTTTRPEAVEVQERVESIVMQYNRTQYDEIEGRRNTTQFWERVEYESEYEQKRRLEKEQAALARREAKKSNNI